MPGQNGGWLHHRDAFPPAIPEAGEQHPEDTIDGTNPGTRSSVNEARELVAQRNIFGDEICTILENSGSNEEYQWQIERHLRIIASAPITGKSPQFRRRIQ
jgi:hypothetical protein